LTDAELVRQAQERNPETQNLEAWSTLSRRYLPVAWRYAYALLQDTHAAEDVVGEAMLALLRNIGQIDADAPKISAWLHSVVRHKVADHHRRVYRAKDHLPRVALEQQRRTREQQRGDGPMEPAIDANTRQQFGSQPFDEPARLGC